MPTDEAIAKLEALRAETLAAVEAAPDAAALRDTAIRYLGRKGPLAAVLSTLGGMEPQERKEVGMVANAVRSALESAVAGRRGSLDSEEAARRLESERVDVTLPGRKPPLGHLHPITQVIDEIVDVFVGLGFKIADGPEVESDYYNFEALNMPQDHPARSMFDTLYIEPNDYGQPLLRTHTSPMWVRAMEEAAPPLYVTMPGRAYRRDVTDPTHLAGFHQIDGLAVDKGISFADLKGSVEVFAKALFGPRQRNRALRRGLRVLLQLRRQRLPDLWRGGVDRDHGGGDGAPERLQGGGLRPGRHGLRLRHGHRAHRPAAVVDRRHPLADRERHPAPGGVLGAGAAVVARGLRRHRP